MNPQPSEKSALDRILDAGVFAPLGLLLTRDKAVADLARAGRKQLAFSRSLGRAAIKAVTAGAKPAGSPTSSSATPEAPSPTQVVIAGYDGLTAREVIAAMASYDDAQLEWIRDHETANKHRVTVLRALDARQSA